MEDDRKEAAVPCKTAADLPTQAKSQRREKIKTPLMREDETQMLKRLAKRIYGENVILTDVLVEDIRERYHLILADRQLNGGA